MNKQELLNHIESYTNYDESILGDLLNLVTQRYNQMVEREKNRRDSAHAKSARDLIDQIWNDRLYDVKNAKLFDKVTCCNMLDALSELYPNCVGGCPAGDEILQHYAESTRELGWLPCDEFIKDIRGKSEWLTKLYQKY